MDESHPRYYICVDCGLDTKHEIIHYCPHQQSHPYRDSGLPMGGYSHSLTNPSPPLDFNPRTEDERLVLGDYYEEIGRMDIARILRDEFVLPTKKPVKEIHISRKELIRSFVEHDNKVWRDCLKSFGSTSPADRVLFEVAVKACFRLSDLEDKEVVWVSHPGELPRNREWSPFRDLLHSKILNTIKSKLPHLCREYPAINNANIYTLLYDDWRVYWQYFGGQFDILNHGYFSQSAINHFNLDLSNEDRLKIQAYVATMQAASFWIPFEDKIYVLERPHSFHYHTTKQDTRVNFTNLNISWRYICESGKFCSLTFSENRRHKITVQCLNCLHQRCWAALPTDPLDYSCQLCP